MDKKILIGAGALGALAILLLKNKTEPGESPAPPPPGQPPIRPPPLPSPNPPKPNPPPIMPLDPFGLIII